MEGFKEIKLEANKLRKEGKYEQALALYKQCWDAFRDECNEWESWGYAYCLQKLKRYNEALELCRESYKKNPEFAQNRNLYAWSIYYTEVKKEKIVDKPLLEKAATGILKLSSQEDKYSPYVATVFKVLSAYKEPFSPSKIIEWCEKLNPDLLDEETFSFENEKGKEMELASKREDYYAMLTQALFDSEKYPECIELCNKGLNQISKFHYSNDIWFKRRIALSYFKLKEYELSLSILTEILKKKKEWFVEKEIAEVHLAMGNTELGTQFAIDAALSPGDFDKKINLYNIIAEILISLSKKQEALEHYILIFSIKKEFEQRITPALETKIKELGGDISNPPQARQQFNKCKNIWSSLKFGDQKETNGKIDKMLPNGKSGFVKADTDGQSYFFGIHNFKGKKDLVKVGQEVKFFIEDSFDKAKNKPSKIAVNIIPIFARKNK